MATSGNQLKNSGGGVDDMRVNRVTKSIDYQSAGENYIGVDNTSVARIITISSVDIAKSGFVISIVDESAGAATNNNITVDTEGAETINGAATFIIDQDCMSVEFISNGTNLFIKNITIDRAYSHMEISSGSEMAIDTINEWHMITQFSTISTRNVTGEPGTTAAITAFADAGGGQVTVTSNGHSIAENDYVSITGTTNYNGLFQITNSLTNTFEITDTFAGDDATGTWRHGSHMVINSGFGGKYEINWSCSITSAGNNKTYEIAIVNGVTLDIAARRKIATGADAGVMAWVEQVDANTGDHFGIAIRNITDTTNVTLATASMNSKRLT